MSLHTEGILSYPFLVPSISAAPPAVRSYIAEAFLGQVLGKMSATEVNMLVLMSGLV